MARGLEGSWLELVVWAAYSHPQGGPGGARKESSREASTGRVSGQLPRPSPGRCAGIQPPAPDARMLSQGAGSAASSNRAWLPLPGLLGPM